MPIHKAFYTRTGAIHTSISLKGNDFHDPQIQEDGVAPSGYRLYGLQDSDALLRCLVGSNILSSAGADVEQIIRVFEPTLFPLGGELVLRERFMEILVDDFLLNTDLGNCRTSCQFQFNHRGRVLKYVSETSPIITTRSMGVGERLADFLKVQSANDFRRIVSRAFECINASKKGKYLDISNVEDIQYFFTEFLPQAIARNFAIMHKENLIIKYSHTGNITAVGGICDLDSLSGSVLGFGDPEPNAGDKNNDIEAFMQSHGTWLSFKEIIQKLQFLGLIPTNSGDLSPEAMSNFYTYYINHFDRAVDLERIQLSTSFSTALLQGPKTKIEHYLEIIQNLGDPKKQELIGFLPVLYGEFIRFDSYEYLSVLEECISRIEEELGVSVDVPNELWFGNLKDSFNAIDTEEFLQIEYSPDELNTKRDEDVFTRLAQYINYQITEHVKAQLDKVLESIKQKHGEKIVNMILNLYPDREILYMEKYFVDFPEELERMERDAFVRHFQKYKKE